MEITCIKTLWPENKDFRIVREDTGNQYIFIHFLTPSNIILNDMNISVDGGTCILYDKFSYQNVYQENCDLIHDWFHIEGDMDNVIDKYGFKYNTLYKIPNSNVITKIIQSIENEFNVNNKYSNELNDLKIQELIITIMHSVEESKKNNFVKSDVRKLFSALRSKINLTYNDDWDVSKMAAEVNLSPSRFYKIYKEIFGISPKKYLQEIRIEHAKTLLMQNKYMIREIAEMTGYKNQYHFIRQFKEYTGLTPGKFEE